MLAVQRRRENLARAVSNLAAALSAALLVACIAAWPWSYRTPRVISYRHGEAREALTLFGGRVGAARAEFPVEAQGWLVHTAQSGGPTSAVAGMMSDAGVATGGWKGVGRLGFATDSVTLKWPDFAVDITDSSRIWIERPATMRYAVMPLWVILVASLPLPAMFIARRVRRRRRVAAGACLVCGYDLRASPQRCPECGADVRPPPAEEEGEASERGGRRARHDRLTRLRRIAIAGIALELALLAVLFVAKLAHFGERAIARFEFDGGASDHAGRQASAELKYAPIDRGVLSLNGIYEHGGSVSAGGLTRRESQGYRAVFRVPQLDYRTFTVSWRFRLDPTDNERPYPRPRTTWPRLNLITGGTSYRWLIISRNTSKQLNIAFNNDNVGLNVPEVELREGVWMRIACSFDLPRRRVLVMLDGRKVADIALPQDFSLEVIGSRGDATDRVFTFTNYSNGTAFAGEIDDLIVIPRAMTEDELSRLAR